MESLKFNVITQTLPLEFCEDFVKKSCWDFFVCSRIPKEKMRVKLLGSQDPIEDDDSSGEEQLAIMESSLKALMKSNKKKEDQ